MLRKIRNTKMGFTLIELLVVISIIGVLSSVILASVKSARNKAKNAKFVNELKSLQNAMALYINQYRQLPNTYGDDYNGNSSLSSNLSALVTNKFIPRIPHHPDWPASSLSSNSKRTYMVFQGNNEWTNGSYSYSYGYACGTFNSWNEFQRSGQMGRLYVYTRDSDLEGLKLQTGLSWCYSNPWGQGCYPYAASYSVAGNGYKYYCIAF